MVQLNKNDLDFILRQIKIAEAHVAAIDAGTDPRVALEQLVSSPLLPYGLRTVDGSFNNFQPGMTHFGSADQPMVRLLDAQFAAAETNPRTGAPTSYASTSGSVYDSQPRIISNLVADQSLNNPAAISAALASVGIVGADALAIVSEVMQLQAVVTEAQAAVTTAADSAAAARTQAQGVINTAQNAVNAAQQELSSLQTELAALVDSAAQTSAAVGTAQAAVIANQAEAAAAQTDVAAKLALMQAASANAAATQDAENVALANLTVAEIARDDAADAYSANPNQTSANALAQATLAYNAARTAYDVAQQNDEEADAALVLAQAAHAASVTVLQNELDQQFDLAQAADLAETAQAAAEAAVASKTVEVNAAVADLADAQADLAAAQADLNALPANDTAAIAVANAAVTAAKAAVTAELTSHGVEMDGDNVFIKNIAADLGDTASFNGFMTIFGQFFDHGLDLTTKGGAGSVYIPLQPDDPLYVQGSPTNFMVLTRATNSPNLGPDGLLGTADDVRDHTNETTPWIDLNQVYTSNPSHQVFLREYVLVGGKPVATGHMLESATGGPPTWKDIKNQAKEVLGIKLDDMNVHAVPAVVTDLYGEFVRGPNGFPMLLAPPPNAPMEGSLQNPVDAMQAVGAGRAFLNDIAHEAAPGTYDLDGNPNNGVSGLLRPDEGSMLGIDDPAPTVPGAYADQIVRTVYDNELLDRHFIVGDGRGNENIALTATHAMFHGEHNRQVEDVKKSLITDGDLAFLNEWLAVDLTASEFQALQQGYGAAADKDAFLASQPLVWDGERLFQTARFSTEMVYQHLVFEEFVRAIAPQIDPFVFSNSVEIDGAIFEEFAQVVYRFGHSMLNENVDILKFDGGQVKAEEQGLIDAFLDPVMFDAQGVDAHAAAGAILRGMTRQAGNEIDEFMTSALRDNLVGLPLDLAALNIARARETGVPSLNEARRQIFEQTQDTYLKPYESWVDFAQNLKNPLSIVNFIAAYGTHSSILSETTAEAKRDAAWSLVFGGDGAPSDRLDFLNATGVWAGGTLGGLNKVDFWIGGLAEALMPFGGMLGSTFTFVFELQIEKLQNGDRFYYLSRTQGLNLLTELESDSFADLIRRNTDTEEVGLHINGAAFQTADYVIEMEQSLQYNAGLGNADPTRPDDVISAITGTTSLVTRAQDYLKYNGGEHVVLGGTNRSETIIGGAGDDTIWGEGGNDRIEGGYGVDHIHGGEGSDIITDSGTDIGAADVLKGEGGDDLINGGMGLDLVFGGDGSDILSGGSEAKSIFGGEGDDYIRSASGGGGVVYGNEGDDWMEGQGNMNTLTGDNSELFFNSRVIGHDIMISGENDTDFDAESGDDIMVQGIGINRSNGMAGFDWTTFKGNDYDADADMNVSIFVNQQNNILRDRYDLVEGLSGWKNNDTLTGRDVVIGGYDAAGNAAQVTPDAPIESFSNALLEKNVDNITGLRELLAHLERFVITNPNNANGDSQIAVMDTSDGSDILLGGGGSDMIRGMGGNDIIDGDKWLNVRIRIDAPGGPYTADSLAGLVYLESDLVNGMLKPNAMAQMEGATLDSLLFSRTFRPGQLSMVREIVDGSGADDVDTAFYYDNFENYEVTYNDDGSVTVAHINPTAGVVDTVSGRNLQAEGTDRLFNIEKIQFADRVLDLRNIAPEIALDGFDTVTSVFADNFNTASATNNTGTSSFTSGWVEAGDGTNSVTGGNVQIDQGNSNELRFNPNAANGAMITRTLDLSGMQSATVSFVIDDNNVSPGSDVALGFIQLGNDDERLHFEFAADGLNFVTLASYNGSNGGNQTITLPMGDVTTGLSAIRFRLEGTLDQNGVFNANIERFIVDNLTINASGTQAVTPPNQDITSTFVEGQAPISVGSQPLITDNGQLLASARVVLTNAQTGDSLAVGGLPNGITAMTTQAGGAIVVTLAGEATLLAYQAAIQAITFANSSDAPSVTPRVIEVTVNDGRLDSEPATHTVTITPVDDPMQANNDRVVTNFTNGVPFIVPSWSLLVNDTDPDSTVAISAITATSSLNAVLGPNGVSITDTGNGNNANGGTFTYRGTGTDTATVTVVRDTNQSIDGGDGNDILIGDNSSSELNGGAGNDIVVAGGGDDTINQTSNQGRDIVDGGIGNDTYVLSGVGGQNGAERFRIYAVTNNQNAALAAMLGTVFLPTTEIVITRALANGIETVVAELDNIEEIRINTLNVTANNGNGGLDGGANGGDIIEVVGNFDSTSLNYSTITIDGSSGDDVIDISALSSAHRIVFRSNGGNDTIVGALRPQDVVEVAPDANPEDYSETDNGDGTTTLSNGSHSLTFTGEAPTLVDAGAGPDHDDNGSDEEDEDDDGVVVPPPSGSAALTLIGTASADALLGAGGDDTILGGAATDVLVGQGGSDILRGEDGDDVVSGGDGNDVINAGLGDDEVHAGGGNDMVFGGAGSDLIFGDAGNDVIEGGAGDDRVWAGAGDDTVIATLNDGNDVYYGEDGTDTLDYAATSANLTVDLGNGFNQRGSVSGGTTGSDTFYGFENFIGGSGHDTIVASSAVNVIDGGLGDDVFKFTSAANANGDTIYGFQTGDRIDFSGMGAMKLEAGQTIDAIGDVTITHEMRDGEEFTVIRGNTQGDNAADFELSLQGRHNLTINDFLGVS
jgi:Ca2+-binding RTX toxin-like protein